ncbi:MAG: nucleoside-diphosphate kinase [DPANN group archaeon]|nr:nucleoside-diphosphate kinase [DPANN group archaeon]
MEKTFMMVKPDGVKRALTGTIIQRVEQRGLKIIALKMILADKELVGKHYVDDAEWCDSVGKKTMDSWAKRGVKSDETPIEIGKRIRQWLMDYITSGPVVAMVIEGHDTIKQIRKLVGDTSPHSAAPGTIRGDFSIDSYAVGDQLNRPIKNLVHASGNKKEAQNEISLWFNKDEVQDYKRIDEDLIYRT